MATKSFYINASSYTSIQSGSSSVASAVGYSAENPSSTTTNWYSSSSAGLDAAYAQYTFDLSSIPSSATNIEVACVVAGKAESTTYTHSAGGRYSVWGLCCNGTAKGSQVYTTSTSATTVTFTDTGTWTREELDNLQLRHYVGNYGGTTNGATLTITYVDITHKVTVTITADNVTVDKTGEYDVSEGDSFTITTSSGQIAAITDNGIDVVSSIVTHQTSGGSTSNVLGTYTLVSGSFNSSGATYFSGLVGNGHTATTTSSNYYSSSRNTQAVFQYDVSFSDIPSNATITNVYMMASGHAESTSNSSEYMCVQLKSGSAELSDQYNFKDAGTSNTTQTITCTTIPTVDQLANLVVECTLGYYGGAINGVTVFVEYTLPTTNEWYTYTINSVTEEHIIIISNSNIESGTNLYINQNGSMIQVKKVLQKVSGNWEEMTDLETYFTAGRKFQRS